MPSPFPGMDPYIEARNRWADFHHNFIIGCQGALNAKLPRNYVATSNERLQLMSERERRTGVLLPDVSVVRRPGGGGLRRPGDGSIATLEPHDLAQSIEWLDHPKELFLEIHHLPDRGLVTSIEVLSPSNKREPGWSEFAQKRLNLLSRDVNLVEIDLLLDGQRLELLDPLPSGDYFAFLTRLGRSHRCETYAWDVRDPLPTIPVPLQVGDADVPLDLAAVFAEVYERGRYWSQVDYEGPLPPMLRASDQAWAAERAEVGIAELARQEAGL